MGLLRINTNKTEVSLLYADEEIAGHTVAAALEGARARIAERDRFTADAYALDEHAEPVREMAELPSARRLGVLAAIGASTADVAVQAAACRACRYAADVASTDVSLARVGQAIGHAGVLGLLDDAIGLALSSSWTTAVLQLPGGPPTEAEWREMGFQHQVIDVGFFGSERSAGGQFEMTWGVAEAARAELALFNAYLDRHRDAIQAMARRAERRIGTRLRRVARRVRVPASRFRRRRELDDQTAF